MGYLISPSDNSIGRDMHRKKKLKQKKRNLAFFFKILLNLTEFSQDLTQAPEPLTFIFPTHALAIAAQ